MPEYAPGTPSWVELSTPDADASAAFYREVMNWSASEPGPAESGGYRMFQQDGKNVAGLMGHMQAGQPTAWATYVSVADADETAQRVKAAGGSAIVEPMDVMDIGRMAVFADPTGAVFGVWQPKTFAGADLVNEPNSLCWNEVHTRDTARRRTSTRPSSAGMRVDPRSRGRRDIHHLGARRQAGWRHDGMTEGMFRPRCLPTGACVSRSPTATPPSPRRASWVAPSRRADGHADWTLRGGD
jgi:predicted enzyme related to lactoylglutathione lyase